MNEASSIHWRTPRTLAHLSHVVPSLSKYLRYPVSKAVQLYWRLHPDLRLRYPLNNRASRLAFLNWMFLVARLKYAGMGDVAHDLQSHLDIPDTKVGTEGLSRLMLAIYQLRPDLQSTFDIATSTGRSQLFCWYVQNGRREYQIDSTVPAWQSNVLAEIDERIAEDPVVPISRLMAHLWFGRPDIQKEFPLTDRSGRIRFAAWFYFIWYGSEEVSGYVLPEQLAWLFRSIAPTGLRRDAWLLWGFLSQLQSKFAIREPVAQKEYVEWFSREGASVLGRLRPAPSPAPDQAQPAPLTPAGSGTYGKGINLLVETAAEAAHAQSFAEEVRRAGLESVIVRIDLASGDAGPRDAALHQPFIINVFCMSAGEIAQVYFRHGAIPFHSRFNVALCLEPSKPADFVDILDLVDEIWVAGKDGSSRRQKRGKPGVKAIDTALADIQALIGAVDAGDPQFSPEVVPSPQAVFA